MRLHWPLINIALLFLAPVMVAWFLLKNPMQFHSVAHGKFLQPAISLDVQQLEQLTADALFNHWAVIYVTPEVCDQKCLEQKHNLTQIHTALGAARDRVQMITVTNSTLKLGSFENSILIMEPRGNCILEYKGKIDNMGLLKDIRRLLKYSHV